MLQFPQHFQLIRPTLPLEELSYRNQFFKNWGQLNPYFFKNGDPLLLLPPYKSLISIAIAFLVVLKLNTLYSSSDIELFIRICFVFMSLACYFWACASCHGVASDALPLLNEQTYRNYRGFCEPCRVFTGELGREIQMKEKADKNQESQVCLITHCKQCRVCYFEAYYHSPVLGVCMTKSNYWRFLCFNVLATLTILRVLMIMIL